jgi:manganese/zinc/iron transport system permease protein
VAGTPLVVAYLVIPPVSALLLSRHLGLVFTLSILFGVLATFGGVLIAVSPANLPISPTIIGCMVALLAIAWLLERVRKLVGRLVAPRPAPERLYDVETA